MKGINTRT